MRRATRRIAATALIALAGIATSPAVDQSHLLDSAAMHARQGLIHTGTHRAHLTGLIPPGPFSVTREASGLIPPGPFNATSQVG